MKILSFLLIYIISCIFISCEKVEPNTDLGKDYFPMKIGNISYYSVDSIVYSSINKPYDSIRKYIRIMAMDLYSDSNGMNIYKMAQYTSIDTTKGWHFETYFYYHVNDYFINKVFGGITRTEFVFPVRTGRKWNVNTYNSNDTVNALYSFVGKPWLAHSDCVEVLIKNEVNIFEENVDKQVYVKNEGMVFKEYSKISKLGELKNGIKIITKKI